MTVANPQYYFQPPQKTVFYINKQQMPTPSTFHWTPPGTMGTTGSGRQRLYPFWQLDLTWNNLSFEQYSILLDGYYGSLSGSITAGGAGYTSILTQQVYSSTVSGTTIRWTQYGPVLLDLPIAGNYIDNNYFDTVKMTIRRISVVKDGFYVTAVIPIPDVS